MKVRLFSEVEMERAGWKRDEGDVVFYNPALGAIVRVAMCNDEGTPLWDQFLHMEPVGAITVPVNSNGDLGFVVQQRPTISSSELYIYPNLESEERKSEIVRVLDIVGTPSLELPRGFPLKGEAPEQTAKREADQELDSPILEVQRIGEVVPNTAFNPHRIPVFLAKVNEKFDGEYPPDVNEKILKVEWNDPRSVKRMIAGEEMFCGMSLAALSFYFSRQLGGI